MRASRCVITLEEIKFGDSHNVMRGNDVLDNIPPEVPEPFRVDWGHSGQPYSQPAWRRRDGRNVPVSYTRGTTMYPIMALTVDLQETYKPLQGCLIGTPVGPEDPAFTFRSNPVSLKQGTISVQVDGQGALPEWPQRMDRRILWRFDTKKKGTIEVGESGPHTVFVTFDTPVNTGRYVEEGVTRARMEEATRRIAEMDDDDQGRPESAIDLIDRVVQNCGEFVLGERQLSRDRQRSIRENGALREYINNVSWPDFFPGSPESGEPDFERYRRQGGAWPLASLREYGGECQAIVRLVRGILHQLGFSDGEISSQYVGADFRNPSYAIVSSMPRDVSCRGPRPDCSYALLSQRIGGPGRYKMDKLARNNYEAYLRYRYEDGGHRYQAWYGGGIGLVGRWQEEVCRNADGEEVMDIPQEAKNQLVRVFEGIAEYQGEELDGSRPRARVLRYHPYE